jgi:uncharacterized protein YbcI
LNAAISNAVVRIQREYLGCGPDKARTTIHDQMVVIVMQDTLTKAERSLVADGQQDEVTRVRQRLQHTMRSAIVETIEALTRRTVVAFMSANHIDPDLSCEIVLLDRHPAASERPDDA